MTAQEMSDDLQALFSAAIEATYLTRNIDGIERCVDVLIRLKSASLSVSDIQRFSESIFRLETLRTHKSPKIREVSQSLFDSWLATLLLPPPKRVGACQNPKTEEMVELFEAAKKAADLANAKGIISGKADASRCVEAISLLMKMNVTPKPQEPRRMMERLQGLTKHKDCTICNAATALLQLWRQRIREDETKAASTIDMILCKPRQAHQIRGQGFTRERFQSNLSIFPK